MRSRLQKHSRRIVAVLLAAVVAELLYVVGSIAIVGSEKSILPSIGSWFAAYSPLAALTFHADPNRMLPGLVSGSRVRLSDELLRRALQNSKHGSTGSLQQVTPGDLAEFYRSWKFDTSVRYLVPCVGTQTFFGRLQRSIDSLQDLFPKKNASATETQESLINTEYPLRTYNYDPRVATSVYFDEILHRVHEQGEVPFLTHETTGNTYPSLENIGIPFNWYDWTDSQIISGFIDLPQSEKPQCKDVVRKYFDAEKVIKYERKFGYKLFEEDRVKGLVASKFHSSANLKGNIPKVPPQDYCDEDTRNVLLPGFRSRAPLNFSRPELYALQARVALFAYTKSPNSITFLNRNGSAIQLPVQNHEPVNKEGLPQHVIFNGLLENYLQRNVESYPQIPDSEIEFDNVQKFHELKEAIFSRELDQTASSTTSSEVPQKSADFKASPDMPYFIEMSEQDFEFDAKAKIKELEQLKTRSRHQQLYLESLQNSINTPHMKLGKYFHEAAHVADYIHLGHHFDARFFRGILERSEMRTRLDAIVRAYLNFVHSNGLSSWLSHGTLYGWLYNGMAFPWDGDHDMQMPIVHLNILAERFNQTLIVEDPEVGNGRFFLDVTDSITSRIHGNGNNNIDARFIDVDSGLYVDITGLSVSSAEHHERYKPLVEELAKSDKDKENVPFFKDPNIVDGVTGPAAGKEKSDADKVGEDRYNTNKRIKVYNCRNHHFNHLSELSPLRLTFFHGAKAYVPHQSVELLKHEYHVPEEYSYIEYSGKVFVPELRVWMDTSTLNTMAKGAGSPVHVDTDHLKNPTFSETSSLFQNAAILADSAVETMFTFLWNTFQVSIFRQKELELMYDEGQPMEDRNAALKELVRNRAFNGGYKDPFQNRLETVVWYNLLDRSSVSFYTLDKALKTMNLENADRLLDLNVHKIRKEFSWATEAGFQFPPSKIDFNHRGTRFFTMGEDIKNKIFASDPKDPKANNAN
ncbi:LADA_0H18492g1_1 [Lachancea dasiensis]|uniref:LADA_0H18492g1_1 n=1 Tax=Lachancea dasiensis TaxID=1072105 RepID=A0A1G4K5Z3_9SACH|nr:LADA_0H18492g1_1 [Lachancea dasiensis]